MHLITWMRLQKFPKLSKTGLSMLNGLLTYDPERRLTARQALRHPYLSELPLAKLPQDMPYFPSAHDADATDDQHKRFALAVYSNLYMFASMVIGHIHKATPWFQQVIYIQLTLRPYLAMGR